MKLDNGTIVTLDMGEVSSNTFTVERDEGDFVLLTHPLADDLLMRVSKDRVNTVNANLKDSTERCIDFGNSNRKYLDYNSSLDLNSLGIIYAFKRKLTPKQKQILSGICGKIASSKFSGDLKEAMRCVVRNDSILDDFNRTWYNNFADFFSGKKLVISQAHKSSIFNIAGFVLAQLETPIISTSK